MSELRDALLFLELEKGGEAAGPLFEEPRRRLESDPALRAGWNQFQALKALGWEIAPEPGEKLIRAALAESRRERVKQQLARAAGSEDLAREILLGRVKENRGLPLWSWLLVLALGAGAAWWLLGPQLRSLFSPGSGLMRSEATVPEPLAAEDAALPFEFPAQTPPAQAALTAPEGAADSTDVKQENRASSQARRLLRQHLQAQGEPSPQPTLVPKERRPAPNRPQPAGLSVSPIPTAAPTAGPTLLPTKAPTLAPTPAPTPAPSVAATSAPTALPTPLPTAIPSEAAAPVKEAALALSAPSAKPGGRINIRLDLPERREVDLRLFDQRGRPVKSLHSGDLGPGAQKLVLKAVDEQGRALAPGTYYLRVMTPWFSRVEPIEIMN